jgi:hypothetical protein
MIDFESDFQWLKSFLKMYTICLHFFFDIYKEGYSTPELFVYRTTKEYDAENTYWKENVLL